MVSVPSSIKPTIPVLPGKVVDYDTGQTMNKPGEPPFEPSTTIDGYEVQRGGMNQIYDRVKVGGTWYSVPKGTPTSMYQTYAGMAGRTPEQMAALQRVKEQYAKTPEQFTPEAKKVVEKLYEPEQLATFQQRLATDSAYRAQVAQAYAKSPETFKPFAQQFLQGITATTVTASPQLGGGGITRFEPAPQRAIPLTPSPPTAVGKGITSMAVQPSAAGSELTKVISDFGKAVLYGSPQPTRPGIATLSRGPVAPTAPTVTRETVFTRTPTTAGTAIATATSDFGSNVASRLGAGFSNVAKAFTPPKPTAPVTTATPLIGGPKVTIPEEIQISGSTATNTAYAKLLTDTGESRYAPIPTVTNLVAASLKAQPFGDFRTKSLDEASKFYDVEAVKIYEKGEVPQPKEEYLAQFEKQYITPQSQEQIIRQQYPTVIRSYVEKNLSNLPTYTKEELGKVEKLGINTEFFRGELAAGRVPKGLEALTLSNIAVSAPAIAGGIAKGLGQKEIGQGLIEYGQEEQAKVLGRAAVAGTSVGGTLGFGAEQLGETYTGVAGTTIGLGIVGGSAVKSIGAAKVGGTAIGKLGPITRIGEEAILHPNLARVATYGLAGGLTLGLDVAPLVASGAPPGKVVTELTKTGVGLAGFRYGFKYGLQQGFPIKYENVGYPTTGGKEVKLAKVLSVEDTGRSQILLSKTEGAGPYDIRFGTPQFGTAPTAPLALPKTPLTATEAKVIASAFQAPGGSLENVVKMKAIQSLFGATYKGPAPVKPSEFEAKSSHFQSLADKGKISQATVDKWNKALTDTVRKYSKDYIEVYGTTAGSLQTEAGTMRTAKDVDILARAREDKAIGIVKNMVDDLKSQGIPAFVSPEKATLITLGKGADKPHLVDLHYIGEPTPDVIQATSYGYSLGTSTTKIGGVDVSKLSTETARKLSSVGTLQPGKTFATTTVGPELPKRFKDLADVTRYVKNIEAGFLQVGDARSAAKIASATESYIKAFGPSAIPTEPIAATPLFQYTSGAISPTVLATLSAEGASRIKLTPSAITIDTPKGSTIKITPSATTIKTATGIVTTTKAPSSSVTTFSNVRLAEPPGARAPSPYSPVSISPLKSPYPPSLSRASVSPSISASISSLPSLTSSRPPSLPSPPSPSSPSSPSISSPSGSPYSISGSPSRSPSGYSPSGSASIPIFAPPKGGVESRGERPSFKLPRLGKVRLAPPSKRKKSYGIISEGISRQLFGRATFGKYKGEGSAPTKELLKVGITSPGEFLMRGGFVTGGKSKKKTRGLF